MADEFITSVAVNAVGNMATVYATHHVNYFFHFGRIVEEFKSQRKELVLKRGRLRNDVDEAIRQTEVIEKDVEDWLATTDKELEQTQDLEAEIERNKCFNWCPSWGWRYCLSKKVAKKTNCLKKLVDTCNFQRLGYRPLLEGIIEFVPSKDFKASQSSTVAFNAIIKALTTDGVNMIGLYGMPGVGKTTLAKEVGKYVDEQKLFDKRVMVTMSQNPSLNNIRDRIAEILGLKFEAKTEEGKAEELMRRLKGEKILIIIDDVWKDFELKTIGISLLGENEGCKILLTTRLQPVCIQMNCQEKIKLEILAKDEAWALFKDNVDLEDLSATTTELIEVAKELASECQGLPLAIITVAKSLKGQSLNAWKVANKRLKDSRHLDNQGVVGNIYNCLGLSYDYLTGDTTKSCFLLCSLFPEDCDIPIDGLTLIGIGEGLFSNVELMEDQRREIRQALIDLNQFGLLLEINDEKDTVRMHDVVRDFAHWLTCMGDTKFMVKDKMTKWPMGDSFESHITIAIWNSNMSYFPDKLRFEKLKTLIISGGEDLLTIPRTFFEGMKSLKVLYLRHVKFSLNALQCLTNLRALLIVNCKLINKNISSLIKMEKLEILYANNADIHKLSEEFGRLRHLKYLCFKGDIKFPSNLLSRLTSLQELHVLGRNNINLWELNSLSFLTALSLHISSERLPEGFVFPKVQSYSIHIRKNPTYMREQTLRMLEIHEFSTSLCPFKELFCYVEKLVLYHVFKVRYIVSNEEAIGLNKLTCLELSGCDDLEYLIEPTQNMHHYHERSLQSLKVVEVTWCKKLKSIFSPYVAHNLLHLQQLCIRYCDELEQVFGFAENHVQIIKQHQENQQLVLSNLINLEMIDLPKLRYTWPRSTHLISLSSLKTLKIQNCGKLESLFSSSLAQTLVHLEHISINSCEGLEHLISVEAQNGDAFCWPKLTTLEIERCKSLEDVFSVTLAQGLPSLGLIRIVECPHLMGLFSMAKDNEELPHHLQFLKSQSFMEFTNFSMTDYFDILPSLTEFDVHQKNYQFLYRAEKHRGVWLDKFHLQDDKLCKFKRFVYSTNDITLRRVIYDKNLVPDLDPKEMRKLTSLTIEAGEGLECLIDATLVHDIDDQALLLSNLSNLELSLLPNLKCLWKGPTPNDSLQSLKVINISGCNELKYVFPSSLAQSLVQLQQLVIADCDKMEYIISESKSDNDLHPSLPSLQDLDLQRLKILSGFTSQHNLITLPCLKKLSVQHCPQLVNFYIQSEVNEHVGLKELGFYGSGYDMSNINQLKHNLKNLDCATILEIFQIEDAQLLSKVESILLYEMHQLRGPINFVSLQYLTQLTVHVCNGLKSIFSPMVARKLPQLTLLQIEECEKLEEIIDTTSTPSSSAQANAEAEAEARFSPISFANLESLRIIKCNNLKSIFPVSVIHSLSKIKTIEICEASKLEQIFKYQAELDIIQDNETQKRIVLFSLQDLDLRNLSSLRSLAPTGYHFILPSYREKYKIGPLFLTKIGCPLLTTSYIRVSKEVMHAITQCKGDMELNLEGNYEESEIVVFPDRLEDPARRFSMKY